MSEIGLLAIGFVIGVALTFTFHLIAIRTYICDGAIVMYEDEMYLCLTERDKAAFEHHSRVNIRLDRKKFNGFSET